jgi:hypothetical protein
MTRVCLGVFAALLVALPGGWLWGTADTRELVRVVHVAELRQCLLEAHSSVLSARLDVDSGNFRDASRHLENARRLLQRSRGRLEALGLEADAPRWDWVLGQVEEAQRLAHELEQRSGVWTQASTNLWGQLYIGQVVQAAETAGPGSRGSWRTR